MSVACFERLSSSLADRCNFQNMLEKEDRRKGFAEREKKRIEMHKEEEEFAERGFKHYFDISFLSFKRV